MADNYKVKSDYTVLRRKSRQTSKGDVFENNLMTITPMEILLPEGQSIVYSDSNFKFSVRTDTNLKRRHSKNDWVRNASGGTEWILENIMDAPISDESKIRIKPDYNSLRDFAYYGSAVDMIHATVNHVLMYFPGELYFSDDKFEPTDKDGKRKNIGNYYIVYNECEINIDADLVDESTIDNPNRYLCLSIDNYQLLKDGEIVKESGLTRSNFQRNPNFCDEGILGTVTIDGKVITVYVMAGQKYYLTNDYRNKGYSIRPNQDIINEYFETIDEFESVLLNRDSNPVYKAIFETTEEKEDGYYYTLVPYVWPSINNWTPDMHSSAYYSYIMRLIKLAEYHDEFDSNNIWRMMTHESIKNLDWTFFRENGDDIEDMSNIDSSRIEAILQLYGRQYDGLKRYIDNIKHTNKVTYDQKNNIPDYLLTDTVENSGFEAILPIPTAKTSVETETLYSGLSKGFNEVDLNTYFMRNLKLNAPYINSVKGTREGIEAMLGLLGFSGSEYTINEYITVAKGSKPYCEMDSNAIFGVPSGEAQRNNSCAYPAAIDIEMVNVNKDSFPINELVDDYYGIACKPVIVYKQNGTIDYRYVVPWFENGKYYDGNWYFQCNGGWGKQDSINVSGMTILDNPIGISELSGDFIYEETENRMRYAQNIDEMLSIFPSELEDNDICYVTDVSNLLTAYGGVYSANTTVINEFNNNNPSHYFVIKNKTEYCVLSGESGEGWLYIPLSDITSNNPSDDAKRVIYLETIKDNTVGNNPHVAKKQYDNGEEYVERLDYIFKEGVETNDFTYFSDTDINEAIKKYKFNILSAYTVDNRKSDYFFPKELSNLTISGNSRALTGITEFTNEQKIINPEGGTTCKEPAANSLINLKNIEITFIPPTKDNDILNIWKHYLKTVVFKYIEQILPSTCILRWKIDGEQPTPVVCSLVVNPSGATIPYNGSVDLTAKYECTDGTNINVTNSAIWSSSNGLVNVVNGRVTSNTENGGTSTVTARYNGKSSSSNITITKKPDKQIESVNVIINRVPVISAAGGTVTKDTSGVDYSAWTVYDDNTTGPVDSTVSNTVRGAYLGTSATTEQVIGQLTITAKTGTVAGTATKDVKQEANICTPTSVQTTKTEISGDTTETPIYSVSVENDVINVSYEAGIAQNIVTANKTTEYEYTGWEIVSAITTTTSAYTSGARVSEEDVDVTVSGPTTSGWTKQENIGVNVRAREAWQTVTTGNSGTIRYEANNSYEPRSGFTIYTAQGNDETSGMTVMVQEGKPAPATRTIIISPKTNQWAFEVANDALLEGDYVTFVIKARTESGSIDIMSKIESYGALEAGTQVSFTNMLDQIVINDATVDAFDVDVYISDGSSAERRIKVEGTPTGWMNGIDFVMTAHGTTASGKNYTTIHIPAGTDTYRIELQGANPTAVISLAD